jgi:hypothetical protein
MTGLQSLPAGTPEPDALVGVDIWCYTCGDRVRHRHGAHADGRRYITIIPCDTCIDDADADGVHRGYKLAILDETAVPDGVLRDFILDMAETAGCSRTGFWARACVEKHLPRLRALVDGKPLSEDAGS